MFFFLFSSLTPPRSIERHRSLGPRPIIHFFFLTPPCGPERHCSLGPRSILFLTPHRGTEWHRSLGPRPPDATPWHRATLLSPSATACAASVSVLFRSKERGTRVKNHAKKMAQVKERGGGTPWHRATRLSRTATDVVYFFPYATSWHSDASLLALDQNVISFFLSYNQHLISKEPSVEISRHHVEHWAMLPNSSLKPGFSFQKESYVTRRHKDTIA